MTRKDVFATGESTRYPMTSPSDEVFNGAAAWAEVAELNQRLYDARKQIQTLTEEREQQSRETTSIHEDMLALGRAVGAPYDGLSSPAGYLHGAIMPKIQTLGDELEAARISGGWLALEAAEARIQTLTEERDEARGLHEMSADSVVKLRHELVEAQANEAAQIAKGLQLAAQLDEARALLRQFGTRKPDGQPTTWARAQDVAAFLQPSNEEREEIAP